MERHGGAGRGTLTTTASSAASTGRQRRRTNPRLGSSNKGADSLDVAQASLSTVPTSSWDSESEGPPHESTEAKEDKRKLVDLTTPTLLEETYGEDEEEMVELSQQHHRHQLNQSSGYDHNTQARDSEALRRTPGASQMHQSNRDMLGFGLTLSTPVAARSQRESQNYTPAGWTLSKNPHLGVSHGAFSPNTLRLTEDLDNLLLDDDDCEPMTEVFRASEKESWTTQFIFSSEGGQGSRQKKSTNRPRRNQLGRRNTNCRASPSGFSFLQTGSFQRLEEGEPLHFGGAFAPPHLHSESSFRRPVPSATSEYQQQQQPSQSYPSSPNNVMPTLQQQIYSSDINHYGHQSFLHQHSHSQSSFKPQLQMHDQPNYAFGYSSASGFAMQHPQSLGGYDQRHNFVPPDLYFGQVPQNWSGAPAFTEGWRSNPRLSEWSGYGDVRMTTLSPTQTFVPHPQYSAWNHQQHTQQQYAMQVGSRGLASPTLHMEKNSTVGNMLSVQSAATREWREPKATLLSTSVPQKESGKLQTKTPHTTQHNKEPPVYINSKGNNGLESPEQKSPQKMGSTGSAPSTPSKVGKLITNQKQDDDASWEDAADVKRAELVESPAMRSAFKDFYRKFRIKERISFTDAKEFALSTLKDGALPETVQWRVYLELADLAKRSNQFDEARKLYRQVCELQPYASQGWLEYSKLEEEGGRLNRCSKILQNGLEYCALSENLLTRAIKHEEKLGNLHRARQLLARLKHVGIEKVWRTVLEGALLEARAGNHNMARRVLKYLMHHVPWYGPLYLESYRLEKDLGLTDDALSIVEKGLKAIPRYGPLWFSAFRLCEAIDVDNNDSMLSNTLSMFDRAQSSISRELLWKVHLEAAQILERSGIASVLLDPAVNIEPLLELCRKRYALTVLTCPSNLCWKVWLAGGRMELATGNVEVARKLFFSAYETVPDKGRIAALLECARLEEFDGNLSLARAILCKCRSEGPLDWKVWLESVLLEIRHCCYNRAADFAKNALTLHPGTGRLWASLVQLRYFDGGEVAQYSSLRRALRTVPKSGEVWCEGGRIHLNPFSSTFDLDEARRHFFFATRFTPQYGDSFIESLRLEVIERSILPIAASLWEAMNEHMSSVEDEADISVEDMVLLASRALLVPTRKSTHYIAFASKIVSSVRSSLEMASFGGKIDDSDLELKCANADPNYGLLWFHCRTGPIETARKVLARAREQIIKDVRANAHLYIIAIIRRNVVMANLQKEMNRKYAQLSGDSGACEQNAGRVQWDSFLRNRLRATPSIGDILKPGEIDQKSGTVLLESSVTGSSFGTGLVELNKYKPLEDLTLIERRKILFGSDALFS